MEAVFLILILSLLFNKTPNNKILILGGKTMKQFMDKDFLLSTPTAQHLFHDTQTRCQSLTITATSTLKKSLKTESLKTSHRYGSAATTTNGALCVPAVWMSITSPEKLQTKRNSSNGLNLRKSNRKPTFPLEPSRITEIFRIQRCFKQKNCGGSLESL